MGSDVGMSRHRLSVPHSDLTVREWMAKQANVSSSIRQLIRMYVEQYGMTDPTCIPVMQVRKPGRPSNAEKMARVMMESDEGQTIVSPGTYGQQPHSFEPAQQVATGSIPVVSHGNPAPNVPVRQTGTVQADADGFVDPMDFFK